MKIIGILHNGVLPPGVIGGPRRSIKYQYGQLVPKITIDLLNPDIDYPGRGNDQVWPELNVAVSMDLGFPSRKGDEG